MLSFISNKRALLKYSIIVCIVRQAHWRCRCSDRFWYVSLYIRNGRRPERRLAATG
jgi:hypothetical protein